MQGASLSHRVVLACSVCTRTFLLVLLLLGWSHLNLFTQATTLSLTADKHFFTIDGKPTFLEGVSYFGIGSVLSEFIEADLKDIQRDGFNWVRCWVFWAGNWSVLTPNGQLLPGFTNLMHIIQTADKLGMIVDQLLL